MKLLVWEDLDVLPLFRHPKRRKGSYIHKNQVDFYSLRKEERETSDESDVYVDVDLPVEVDPCGPSEHFRKRYRFQPKTVEALCLLLGGRLKPLATTNNAFTPMQKLCIALRFYATGTHQLEVCDAEGALQSSVSRIVNQVSEALADQADQLIVFSLDPDIMKTVSTGFYGFSGKFPNCIGVIDCTHIPIKPPKERHEQFKCRHGYFSMNIQVIINHRGAITNYVVHWPGSIHDSRILQESHMQEVLGQHCMGKYYLIGDAGYKCQSNLLTPYTSEQTEKQEHFNICLSKTQVRVECVFGQMKCKFACLTKRPDYRPEQMVNVIKACCFLWNFGLICSDNKGYSPDEYVVEDIDDLDAKIAESEGGRLIRDLVADYLWDHK